jgi:hypothetical protein
MKKYVKFATQIEQKALKELKSYAEESGRSISSVVSEAVLEYTQTVRVRPAFKDSTSLVLNEHEELLKRLAK